uniref:Growth hormone-regulated TBC protein 1 n=1 Tax=Plectus sambesii TaxID=2011161 RepID=A0A914UQ73_9BILA
MRDDDDDDDDVRGSEPTCARNTLRTPPKKPARILDKSIENRRLLKWTSVERCPTHLRLGAGPCLLSWKRQRLRGDDTRSTLTPKTAAGRALCPFPRRRRRDIVLSAEPRRGSVQCNSHFKSLHCSPLDVRPCTNKGPVACAPPTNRCAAQAGGHLSLSSTAPPPPSPSSHYRERVSLAENNCHSDVVHLVVIVRSTSLSNACIVHSVRCQCASSLTKIVLPAERTDDSARTGGTEYDQFSLDTAFNTIIGDRRRADALSTSCGVPAQQTGSNPQLNSRFQRRSCACSAHVAPLNGKKRVLGKQMPVTAEKAGCGVFGRRRRRRDVTPDHIDQLMALHFGGLPGSNTDSYGFRKPKDLDDEAHGEFWSNYFSVLARREKRWQNVELNKGIDLRTDKRLKRFIRKGVPQTLRPTVWMRVSGAEERMAAHPGEFHRLAKDRPVGETAQTIELDLERTFPDNDYFTEYGRASATIDQLRVLLSALACKHPRIGYCQGLNYIGGMMLLVMKDAEKAFWLLDATITDLPAYYVADMRGVKIDALVLHHLIKQRSPELAEHFERLDVEMLLVTTKWFVCWYLETLPIETVMRIWDSLFFEGSKIFFRVALTLILQNKARFLACKSFTSATDLFKQIIKEPAAINCHDFMQNIFTVPGTLSMSTIAQLRVKYQNTTD